MNLLYLFISNRDTLRHKSLLNLSSVLIDLVVKRNEYISKPVYFYTFKLLRNY